MIDRRQRIRGDVRRVLRANRVLIVIVTLGFAGIAAGLALLQKPAYVATASLMFQGRTSDGEAPPLPNESKTAARLAAQGASLMLAVEVLSRVRGRLKSTVPVAMLRGMLTTSVDPSSELVTVTATATDGRFAAAVANEVARSAVRIQTNVVRRQFANTAGRVQRQYGDLRSQGNPDGRTTLTPRALRDRIATSRTLAVDATPASVVQPATVPSSSLRKPLGSTLVGALIGLVLGIGFASGRDLLDRRLRDSADIQDLLSLPVVGRVRVEAMGTGGYLSHGGGRMTDEDIESFRILRANIEALDLDRSIKSILVTSGLAGEGKSTVAASLAAANAEAGNRTLLVECNFRRPCLSERLSLDSRPGLSDYLAGKATPAEVVQVVVLSGGLAQNGEHGSPPSMTGDEAGSFVVISAGSRSLRPAELLASERFRTFLEETTVAYDTVVIDTSPVLTASDTLEIVRLTDCVLLCIPADQTTRDQARSLKEAVAHQPQCQAVVVTGLKPGREHDYVDCPPSYCGEVAEPTSPGAASEPPGGSRQWKFARVVARLAGVNAVVLVAGLITGPIAARALGVAGRGDLAAIIAVLTVGPWLLDAGLSFWLGRERARGVGREELLGAALPLAFPSSLLAVAAAIPLAHAIGRGRPVVTTFLEVGLFLMPLTVVLLTLTGLAVGESRWTLISANGVVGSVLPAIAIVVLAIVGRLTVATAAGAYLVGTLVASLLFLRVLRGMGRLVFDRRRTAVATRYGVKSWASTVAATANVRLDQVLMAGLVPARELGLYAVAVTAAAVMNGLISAVSSAQYPRVAEGEVGLVARSSRVTMGVVAFAGVILGVASPWLIPFVFGAAFTDAVPMALILLVASVPMAGAVVLSSGLNAANKPGSTMRAELVALAFTIPALVVFLPKYGGLLAAVVSLIAYTIRLVMQIGPARQTFSTSAIGFLLPTRADLVWLKDRVRRIAARR